MAGRTIKGPQADGMFVVMGSSIVSFKRTALKSNERALSKMQSDYRRLSVRKLAFSMLVFYAP